MKSRQAIEDLLEHYKTGACHGNDALSANEQCVRTLEWVLQAPAGAPAALGDVELFAWVGEDELGSGVIGLKQGLVPAGYIALVATTEEKVIRESIVYGLNLQAATFGKKIYLCRFTFAGVVGQTEEGTPL